MHRLPPEQQLLILIQASALIGLSFRIWWMDLHRVYMYFFGYLIVLFAQTCVPALVPFDSLTYRNAWLVTEGLIVCFYVLIVLELYSMVFQDLSGIANLSHRYIKLALSVAILVSLLLLGMEKSHGGMVVHLLTFERAVVSSLVLFVLLITAFLVYYPVPLKRNVIVYSIGYAVYFLVKASSIFIFNLGYYHWNRLISNIWLAAFFGCLLFWLFALNRRGESKTVVIGHQWNPTDEERLLAQLKAINTSLLRAAQK